MFAPAAKTSRKCFISSAFRELQPRFVETLEQCVSTAVSNWRIIELNDFVDLIEADDSRPAGKRKPMAVIAVLTNAEKASAPYLSRNNVFDKSGIVEFVSKVQSVVSDTAGFTFHTHNNVLFYATY